MFEQQITGRPEPVANQPAVAPEPESPKVKQIIMIVGGLVILIALILGGIFLFKKIVSKNSNGNSQNTATSTDQLEDALNQAHLSGNFPTTTAINIQDGNSQGTSTAIEYLSFANFYKEPNNQLEVKNSDYKLPLNIKTDVLNYYDVSRKLVLDPVLGNLDDNGFAIIDNPFTKDSQSAVEINNFYSVYDTLSKKQIPTLITSDFITYYYQNILKKAFKDIEENVFYNNLWDLSTEMYAIAKDRYNNRLTEVGNINDPILEGARLEMAYFATALSILKPADGQVNQKNDLSDKSRFTVQEANDFSFNPPQYLKVDVLKEVQLIRDHNANAKSPVLLIDRNYQDFAVPEDYKTNAKLNNFYLTTKWLNSVFPTYYRSSECPNCALDVDDWRVHMVAAGFLAQDLFNNEALKTEWARIYKTLSFFKGLRGDLSYVHYRDALNEVFGKDSRLEDLFSVSNQQMPENFEKLKAKINSYDLAAVEGALNKNDLTVRPQLGVKLLSEFYWPNDYIFSELTTPNVGVYQGKSLPATNVTGCLLNNSLVRCLGFGLDIINLLSDVPVSNSYFTENINFVGYAKALSNLKAKINTSSANWHYNNFWTTLKTIKASLENNQDKWPVFGRSVSWQQRETNRALATWANLQVPLDKFGLYQKYSQADNAASGSQFYEYGYVEPNLGLINELLANITMISDMFNALKLNGEVKSVAVSLNDLTSNLNTLKTIIQKELKSESLSNEDYQFIDQLIKEYRVETNSSKTFRLGGANNQGLTEDLSNVKILLIIRKYKDNLVLTAGPVFNYWEKK